MAVTSSAVTLPQSNPKVRYRSGIGSGPVASDVAQARKPAAGVRGAALEALGKLDAACLASHSGAIVARLEDSHAKLLAGIPTQFPDAFVPQAVGDSISVECR